MAGTLCLWIVLQIAEAELLCCDRRRLLVTGPSLTTNLHKSFSSSGIWEICKFLHSLSSEEESILRQDAVENRV